MWSGCGRHSLQVRSDLGGSCHVCLICWWQNVPHLFYRKAKNGPMHAKFDPVFPTVQALHYLGLLQAMIHLNHIQARSYCFGQVSDPTGETQGMLPLEGCPDADQLPRPLSMRGRPRSRSPVVGPGVMCLKLKVLKLISFLVLTLAVKPALFTL